MLRSMASGISAKSILNIKAACTCFASALTDAAIYTIKRYNLRRFVIQKTEQMSVFPESRWLDWVVCECSTCYVCILYYGCGYLRSSFGDGCCCECVFFLHPLYRQS